jgi:H+-translocating NAD(P) transhydrogenase subunit alpha
MELVYLLMILALAVLLGFALISRVPPLLHTPLMSEANAICGIIIIGALIAAGVEANDTLTIVLGTSAVALATFNVVGGYLVTERMLKMFKKKDTTK